MAPVQLSLAFEKTSLWTALQWALETMQCRATTREMHADNARYLDTFFGPMDVASIGLAELTRYVRAEQKRGLENSTIIKRLSTMKHALREAVVRGVRERIPDWPLIRARRPRRGAFWTRDEFERAAEVCDDDDMAAWLTVGWWTGMHASDIDRFRWRDLQLDGAKRGTWTRRNTKTGVEEVALPLPREFAQWLHERKARLNPHPRDLVVRVPQGYPNGFLRTLCARAGVRLISTIGLRHSCETWLYESGADSPTQVLWLGLTSDRMLWTYRHVRVERITRLLEGPRRGPHRLRVHKGRRRAS